MPKTIFYNARVITMNPAQPAAQAVLVENGKIAKVGTNEAVLACADGQTPLRNLAGNALLPGFIDSHSHFTAVAYDLLMVNAKPAPAGPCDSREKLLAEFQKALAAGGRAEGEWLMGMGYDPAAFPDKSGITRLDLDAVSTDVPIACIHASGHMAVLNTLGLQKVGYWGDFAVPAGGTVECLPDGTPSGLITELAYLSPEIQAKIKAPAFGQVLESMERTGQLYASFGITTAQDSRVKESEYQLLTKAVLPIDIVGIVAPEAAEKLLKKGQTVGPYEKHIRMGGYKMFLDGSPQGKTAWLTEPYFVPPEGYGPDYCGFPIHEDEAVVAEIKICLENGWQLNAHCNGDAAAEQLLRCYAQALRETGSRKALRPVMIHAQTVRPDQLKRMAALGMSASFFLDHVYFWGEWYRESVLGPQRAENISPIRWALDSGVRCTLHQDCPVVQPDMLLSIHNAVNRKTQAGRMLGEQQRISAMEALRAVTLDAAYQIFEEDAKGSIAQGKTADFVILGDNPLTAEPEKIKDIPVLETVKAGVTIYRKT